VKLVEMIYWSRMTAPLSMPEIVAILDVARTNNARFGVTGMLTFGAEMFMQSIEGSPDAIDRLYRNLLKDPRHKEVNVVGIRPIAARRFAAWSMGFYTHGLDGSLAQAGARSDRFDPASMTLEQSVALLTDMARQLETSHA
jgi:hypothetical protein